LLIFLKVQKMGFSGAIKYALFFSSIPFTMEQYLVMGQLLGGTFFLLVLFALILILRNDTVHTPKDDRRYWVVCIIFVVALAATHSVSSIMLSVALLAVLIFQSVPYFRSKSYLRARLRVTSVFAIVLISLAWLAFQVPYALEAITWLLFIGIPSGVTPASERIPPSFFVELQKNALVAVRSFSVLYGADAFLLLLTFVSLVVMLKMKKRSNDVQSFIQLLGWWFLFLLVVGAFVNLGGPRSLDYERLLFPVFSGFLIFWVSNNLRGRKWIRARAVITAAIILLVILLATIELYGCQPLVPSANVVYPELPSNVPIGYVGQVTSIYQRQAIFFAENHVNGLIACDSTTYNQIIGLTGLNWSESHLVQYDPLDKSQPEQMYDYFLIHLPGKAGILAELPPARAPALILSAIYNSSIIYTNGESYMLSPGAR